MDLVQAFVVALAFVSFLLSAAVVHLKLTSVPAPVTTEPSAETLRNQLYV